MIEIIAHPASNQPLIAISVVNVPFGHRQVSKYCKHRELVSDQLSRNALKGLTGGAPAEPIKEGEDKKQEKTEVRGPQYSVEIVAYFISRWMR
jgi:hypothetical protein